MSTDSQVPTDVKNYTVGDGAPGVFKIGSQGQLIAVDSNNRNRLLIGEDPQSNTMKMKLSKSGKDVLTATDDQLAWSSDFNNLKIVQRGQANIVFSSAAAANQIVTITTHNLGYNPIPFVYYNGGTSGLTNASTNDSIPYIEYPGNDSGGHIALVYYHCYVDDTVLKMERVQFAAASITLPARDFNITYYLCRETTL